MATLYIPKLQILAGCRKRGSYYVFGVRVGYHVELQHIRYYPEEQRVTMSGRKMLNSKRRFIKDVGISQELKEAMLKLCQETFDNKRFQTKEQE